MDKRKIGILGYGKLGQHLSSALLNNPQLKENNQLVFVWNRKVDKIGLEIPKNLILEKIENFKEFAPDLIVEVAHPMITFDWGEKFLKSCDYFAGSPTAFASLEIEKKMRAAANNNSGNGLYIPRGALPCLEEILKLKESGNLNEASITMRKHPKSLKFSGPLNPPLEETKTERVLYSGPLRQLCNWAPNNVNTMAVLALASELGFDKLQASLVANPQLNHHITEVCLYGSGSEEERFSLQLVRKSPAGAGAVTSSATFTTFLKSMLASNDQGSGIHFV